MESASPRWRIVGHGTAASGMLAVDCSAGLATVAATSAAAENPPRETTVEIDGKPILPMHGTTAGFWLYANDEGAAACLDGAPAAPGGGDPGSRTANHDPGSRRSDRWTRYGDHAGHALQRRRGGGQPAAGRRSSFRSWTLDGSQATRLRLTSQGRVETSELCIDIAAPAGRRAWPGWATVGRR